MLADRLGNARAPRYLSSPLGLAWRLQRGALIGWGAAFLLGGLVFGGIAANVGDLLSGDNARDLITKLGGTQGLTDAYIGTVVGMLGMIAAAFAVQSAMRLRSEETTLRAEPVLATAVSRVKWAMSHVLLAFAGVTGLLVLSGAAAGLTYGLATDLDQFGRVFAAALVQMPAAWVLTGIVMLGFGFAPRLNLAGWIALGAFVVIAFFGPILELSQWIMDVSPFGHIPKLPGAEFTITPLLWLTAIAVAAMVAGLTAFRRRDAGY